MIAYCSKNATPPRTLVAINCSKVFFADGFKKWSFMWQRAKKSHTRWNLAPRWIVGLQISQKAPKATMLKFGDVSFDLGFERGRMSATGYVAKISMLRLNIGSGKLSSCMLSICRGPKAVQGNVGGGAAPPCLLDSRPMLGKDELSLHEPMVSLSMLILATCPEHAQE